MANAKYRLTPLKERMDGYLETVGSSQVSFEGSFDEATKVAVELLYSNRDFLEVEITKIGKTVMASKKVGKVTSQGVFKYGLGGALIFIGLGIAGAMAYNDYKNQSPENEYKIKLYKKGTLKDTLVFKESYVNKAFQDYSKLGYVVRVAKIKRMVRGGSVGISKKSVISELKKLGYSNDSAEEIIEKHIDIYEINFDDKDTNARDIAMSIDEQENQQDDDYSKGGSVVTYKNKYNKKYGYEKNESHSLEDIAKDTKISIKGLQQIYDKGIGAYKTNPQSVRPNVKSKEQWAMARVYSAVMGGKAAKIDENELKMAKGGGVSKTFREMRNDKPLYYDKDAIWYMSSGRLEDNGYNNPSGVSKVFKKASGIKEIDHYAKNKNYKIIDERSDVNGNLYLIAFLDTSDSHKDTVEFQLADLYSKGGGVKTEFDKGMVLNNLDMIKEYSVAIDKMVTENTKLDEWVKMKLTKVEQNMADVKHAIEGFDKYGEGGRIFKKQLLHISKYATDIKKMVSGKKEVMSWIEGKLFVSADYMDTLYHFLDYESGNTASKYKAGGKVGAEYVVYDWDTYEKLSTHKTIESAKRNMYELYKNKRNLHLAVKNRAEFEKTKQMLETYKQGGKLKRSKESIIADSRYNALPEGSRKSKKYATIELANGTKIRRRNANQTGDVEGGRYYSEKRPNHTDKSGKVVASVRKKVIKKSVSVSKPSDSINFVGLNFKKYNYTIGGL